MLRNKGNVVVITQSQQYFHILLAKNLERKFLKIPFVKTQKEQQKSLGNKVNSIVQERDPENNAMLLKETRPFKNMEIHSMSQVHEPTLLILRQRHCDRYQRVGSTFKMQLILQTNHSSATFLIPPRKGTTSSGLGSHSPISSPEHGPAGTPSANLMEATP